MKLSERIHELNLVRDRPIDWKMSRKQIKDEVVQLEAELEKWRNWKPDDEALADMQQQALAKDGTYTNGLAAGHVYMRGLEARQRELEAELELTKNNLEVCNGWCKKYFEENERLRAGIDKIVAGIRMNTRINYILIMMDELDALKEG